MNPHYQLDLSDLAWGLAVAINLFWIGQLFFRCLKAHRERKAAQKALLEAVAHALTTAQTEAQRLRETTDNPSPKVPQPPPGYITKRLLLSEPEMMHALSRHCLASHDIDLSQGSHLFVNFFKFQADGVPQYRIEVSFDPAHQA